eukprot:TRINITY_DN3747_c0_g1_i1.p1 TRINITY_DN3747_c0_g1~~TRINITY_DN3747_c0_g1_i1.p1  ORF type:complete len:231 (-),score=40.87 TRINITY_DN3747_c0_g1_i1:696-1388(-)
MNISGNTEPISCEPHGVRPSPSLLLRKASTSSPGMGRGASSSPSMNMKKHYPQNTEENMAESSTQTPHPYANSIGDVHQFNRTHSIQTIVSIIPLADEDLPRNPNTIEIEPEAQRRRIHWDEVAFASLGAFLILITIILFIAGFAMGNIFVTFLGIIPSPIGFFLLNQGLARQQRRRAALAAERAEDGVPNPDQPSLGKNIIFAASAQTSARRMSTASTTSSTMPGDARV